MPITSPRRSTLASRHRSGRPLTAGETAVRFKTEYGPTEAVLVRSASVMNRHSPPVASRGQRPRANRSRYRPLLLGALALFAAVNTPSEAQARSTAPPIFATGLEFLDSAEYEALPLASPSFGGPLPDKMTVGPLPRAGHQGGQPSCVGWALAGARSILTAQRTGNPPDPPDRFFSPAWIYNQIRLNKQSCTGFSHFIDGLALLQDEGVVDLAAFPYDDQRCDTLPTPYQRSLAAAHRIASWRRLGTLDETEVKTHLASGTPVLVGMMVDPSFKNVTGQGIFQGNQDGSEASGHAMVVVGYDDDRGAFQLLNSWGEGWGDRGYGWVSYAALRRHATQRFVIDGGGALSAANGGQTLELETLLFEDTVVGTRDVILRTGDHHCRFFCRGEPTRTNYRLELAVDGDTYLRNPEVRCVDGPCHGWNEVRRVRMAPDGRRATASWDVWTKPTTWRLVAEEVRRSQVGRLARRLARGQSFTVPTPTGAPAPRLMGRWSDGSTFTLIAGKPTGHNDIRMVGIEINGPETFYKYEIN